MKDFLNNELNIGDRVVGTKYLKTNSCLFEGEVVKITDKMVRVKNIERSNGLYSDEEFMVTPYKLVKIKD